MKCGEGLSVTAVLMPPPDTPSFVPLAVASSLAAALAGAAWDVFAVRRTVPSQQRLAEGQQQLTPALSTLATPAWFVPRGGAGAQGTVLSYIAAGQGW